jgi:fatty acid desaturase
MRETKLIRLRTALFRLTEGALLLSGGFALMHLGIERQNVSGVQAALADTGANVRAICAFITLAVLAFIIGFAITIEGAMWLFAVIFRGPFVVSGPETDRV